MGKFFKGSPVSDNSGGFSFKNHYLINSKRDDCRRLILFQIKIQYEGVYSPDN